MSNRSTAIIRADQMLHTCPRTGKRVMTRKQAMVAARTWRARFARMSHYRCNGCKGWHVGNDRRKRAAKGQSW